MIAPGADEFLPPTTSGPWLPPERTFSALVPRSPLHAESVRHYEVGVGHEFGAARRHRRRVRRFRQSADDQVATIFGLDAASDVGHYYVATPGSVDLDGWSLRASTAWLRRFEASVEYTAAVAEWARDRQSWPVRRAAPSAIRARAASACTTCRTRARRRSARDADARHVDVSLQHRVQQADGERTPGRSTAGSTSRCARPCRIGRPAAAASTCIVAVRTLMRDPRERGSFYDELLTVAPPLRLVGGVQMRF